MYCINLDKRQDRWEKFKDEHKDDRIERFSAVDGISLKTCPDIINPFYNGTPLNKSEWGCIMSHYTLWLKLAESEDADVFTIFEDDCYKTKQHQDVTDDDWGDLLFLGGCYTKSKWIKRNAKYDRFIGGDWLNCLHAYKITKKCAKGLINIVSKTGITGPIDCWLATVAHNFVFNRVHSDYYRQRTKVSNIFHCGGTNLSYTRITTTFIGSYRLENMIKGMDQKYNIIPLNTMQKLGYTVKRKDIYNLLSLLSSDCLMCRCEILAKCRSLFKHSTNIVIELVEDHTDNIYLKMIEKEYNNVLFIHNYDGKSMLSQKAIYDKLVK